MQTFTSLLIATVRALRVSAFDGNRSDNIAIYWGQNSFGATNNDTEWQQKDLGAYCKRFWTSSLDQGSCENATFPNTSLMDCSGLSTAITSCQNNGKLVTISLGGGSATVGFASHSQATTFAQKIWDMFLGGQSEIRPFGSAILDGHVLVDLDIEGGPPDWYAAFVKEIKVLSMGATKQYYITGAPQCPFPDAYLGMALSKVPFDMIYVQIHTSYHHTIRDAWARSQSLNPDVKVYIGAPASMTATGTGYVNASRLGDIALDTQRSFTSFGGVMFWDMSEAYANDKIHQRIKDVIKMNDSTVSPMCSSITT
ncbi:glycoside hydrolase family 18 protein [Mycena olivaceomarginata]|nr:glycoside hydrolase family 18 protein [Mycena olivaceomarginata]